MAAAEGSPADRRDARLIYVNGDLAPPDQATVSATDAGFLAGDGLYEGFCLHRGRLLFAERHIERLYAGARAIDLDIGMARDDLLGAVELTCTANRLSEAGHIRLTVSRGLRRAAGHDPRHVTGRPTIVIAADPPPPLPAAGLKLFTASLRCAPADLLDMRLKTLSRLNLIAALLQASKAGADAALLLDPRGFVATADAGNVFIVRGGAVYTATGAYGFSGITRALVLELCDQNRIPCFETDLTLAEAHVADEAFLAATWCGLAPVASLDGRPFARAPGAVTARLRRLYDALKDEAVAVG